jgi:hypothetical protein
VQFYIGKEPLIKPAHLLHALAFKEKKGSRDPFPLAYLLWLEAVVERGESHRTEDSEVAMTIGGCH